jgi:hypothetical protein
MFSLRFRSVNYVSFTRNLGRNKFYEQSLNVCFLFTFFLSLLFCYNLYSLNFMLIQRYCVMKSPVVISVDNIPYNLLNKHDIFLFVRENTTAVQIKVRELDYNELV